MKIAKFVYADKQGNVYQLKMPVFHKEHSMFEPEETVELKTIGLTIPEFYKRIEVKDFNPRLHHVKPTVIFDAYMDDELVEGTKYARQCTITGEGMNEGWIFDSSYFKYEKDALEHAIQLGYDNLEQACDEEDGAGYWTQWEEEDDAQYIVVNGTLVEIEEMQEQATDMDIEAAKRVLRKHGYIGLDSMFQLADIIGRGKDRGLIIDEEMARQIGESIDNSHDANIGINWDNIDYHTDECFPELEKSEEEQED